MQLYRPEHQIRLKKTDMEQMLHELKLLGFGRENRLKKDYKMHEEHPLLDELTFELEEALK